ncbi:MAG: polyribonucleotide nucleotidyltransferase [Candidatus Woykebacteria bacterium RBG_13_40_15]|uniref:Polyribonucleotide nucleotidyltransferase n=1 Tax=Candidatus Woykebacteria bacterium RBG_13_40_15 TaxID=1802593 RepID=A0A1G1W911_9BACT|nr:MAG: polyribonucleotide nucleotidyltransferase [Candidatus Woykebacteria bacterium RBG_13_40_15]
MDRRKLIKKEITWAGKTLSLQYGKIAEQADSAILARYGDTMVLATVVSAPPREDVDFFPLSVDYEEKLYAAGRISTSRFIKREGRPTDEAILNGRLIDRSIRPLFPKDYSNEVQVIVTVLSYDQENDPDIPSLLATSAVLQTSPIPWDGELVGVRVGFGNGGFLLNPTKNEESFSDMSLTVSFNKEKVVMIECGANEIAEDVILEALKFGREQAKPALEMISELVTEVGAEKAKVEKEKIDEKLEAEIVSFIKENFKKDLFDPDKSGKESVFEDMKENLYEKFEGKLTKTEMSKIFDTTVKKMVRENIVQDEKRPDNRPLTEVRPIEIEVGVLPRTHGSAIFRRGDTQVLSVATLGSTSLEQLIEGMEGEAKKRFMHHYTFPPFSTGEVRRLGSPGRREIGHGVLAEKSLVPVIPEDDKFPYTIRVVSEVLSSSGSTSMGSICGSVLALMDAGVPIAAPVSGIAMGLVIEGEKYKILTDLQALEDFYGDMDFKIAGTTKGVTGIQLDVKIDGLNDKIISETLSRAKEGRAFILDQMLKALPKSREDISKYAPKVMVVNIPQKKIGEVIGSGGKTINRIIDETGAAIDIDDDGTVHITSTTEEGLNKAADWIKGLTHEVRPGEIYEGTVKRIMPFGAMVEILPGKEGLVHISQLATYRVEDINKEVEAGQKFKVKVLEIDHQGRVNLTRKGV